MRLVGQLGSACEYAREQISLELDGELSELERVALDGHLTSCAHCRAYRAGVARVSSGLRAAPLEQPQVPFVLPHRSRIRVPLRTFRVGAAAAVVAVVGFAGGGLTSGSGPSVSLTAGTSALDREPILRPTRVGRGVITFRIDRRTTPRPIRGRPGTI
jgi:predicted anti-sigma-YlaC factor YlaD